jgi:hypothetical protein
MATDNYSTRSRNYKHSLPPSTLQRVERDQAKRFCWGMLIRRGEERRGKREIYDDD